MRHKRGDIREDGLVFWSYSKDYKNGELWVDKEKFDKKSEQEIKRKKDWYLKNKQHAIEKTRIWREQNMERKKENARISYINQKEKIKQRSHKWYHSNKERAAERQRNWSKKNPDKHNDVRSMQRARKRKLTPPMTEEEKSLIEKFYEHASRLTKLLKIKHHVDHIIPLAKGGLHHPSNLQVIPASVNLRKGIK